MSKNINYVIDKIKNLITNREEVFSCIYKHKNDFKNYGWEKWLQVELAVELSDLGVPQFEVRHAYRNNVKRPNSKAKNINGFIDLVFRLNNTSKCYKTAIEIKVNSSQKGMSALIQDFRKIKSFSSKDWKYRSVIGVLAFDAPTESSKKTRYFKLIEKLELNDKCVIIRNNYFYFVVVGWESNNKIDMNLQVYSDWLNELETFIKRETDVSLRSPTLPRNASCTRKTAK